MKIDNESLLNQEPITPVKLTPRHACPFYGFFPGTSMLVDQCGNQCPLIDGNSPCKMEMAEETPDWENCPYNCEKNKDTISRIERSSIIFPRDFHPIGQKTWGGMSFLSWKKYVMGDNVERPE